MAVIRGRQTFVNDGGGKSTTSSSTYTAPKTTTTTSSYTAPKTTTSSTYTAPKTTVISSSNYGAPRAVVPVTPQVKTTTPASTPVTTAPQTTLDKATQILQKNTNSSNSALARASQNALNKINNASPQQKAKANQALESASQRLSQDAVDRLTTGVVKQPVAKLGQSAQTNPVTPRVVGSASPQILNNYTAKDVTTTNNNPDTGNGTGGGRTIVEPEPEPTYGGGGSGSGSSPSQSEAEKAQKEVEDTVAKLKELLDAQKRQAEDYYKTLYEQQLASNLTDWENNRNQINRNYMRTNRYLNSMYGDAVSGVGLSNRARNYSNWNNNLAQNDRNRTNNDATALANYDSNLANVASQLAQGYYNYVLPVYTNRQTNADNMDYQVWALQQQLENRRQMNLDDLDYRKYLASLGL